jgi:hypothetical protein
LYDEEARHYLRGVVVLDSQGRQLEVILSSLESPDLAAYCLELAWRTAANEDFKACNLSEYVKNVERTVRLLNWHIDTSNLFLRFKTLKHQSTVSHRGVGS